MKGSTMKFKVGDRVRVISDYVGMDGIVVGEVVNGLFKNSICYEISEYGRETIQTNAKLNNVSDKVDIRGAATKNFHRDLSSNTLSKCVLLIDIEGAEFEILDATSFEAFRNSIIFVELHDWFFSDGSEKLEQLKKDAALTHSISELKMSSRDLSQFAELKKFNDDDRWLLCSEGRGQLMTWLRFDPR